MSGFLKRQNEAKRIADESAAFALEASEFLEEAGAVRSAGEAALYLARANFLIRRADALLEEIRSFSFSGDQRGTTVTGGKEGLSAVAAQQTGALLNTKVRLESVRDSLKALADADGAAGEMDKELVRLRLARGLLETLKESAEANHL